MVSRALVSALRRLTPFLGVLGVDLSGSRTRIPFFTDGKPPFVVTRGLGTSTATVEGMEVWTLTPRQPSGAVVIAVHGGGFIGQASIFHWITYAALARATGATVVVPNYAVATEDGDGGTAATVVPAVSDVIAAQVVRYGADRVSVLGDSAGGNIALAASQELVRRGTADCRDPHLPGRLVLIAPVLDVSMTNPAIDDVDDPLLDYDSSARNGKLWAAGLGDPDDPDGTHHPLASPLFGSLAGLPPTTVYSGSLDLRSPDALVLRRLAASTPGAEITVELRSGQIHDWLIFAFLPDAVRERAGLYRHLGLAGRRSIG